MRYIAFLRAINVGGHVVKMDRLRALFTGLGHANVGTFIASGNVLFDAKSRNPGTLERQAAAALEAALGYPVPTFIRTAAEVTALASATPFPVADMEAAHVVNVGFMAAPLGKDALATMKRLTTDVDAFHSSGREFWWLCRVRQVDTPFAKVKFERTFGTDVTFRSLKTVRSIAEQLSGA